MIKNTVFFLFIALFITSTPQPAQAWLWNKKTTTTQEKSKSPTYTTKRNTDKKVHPRAKTVRLKLNKPASLQMLDATVMKARQANINRAKAYSAKQQAKISKINEAAAIRREQQRLQALELGKSKSGGTSDYYETTPDKNTKTTTKTKRRAVYKPKSQNKNGKKPPRIFNSIRD